MSLVRRSVSALGKIGVVIAVVVVFFTGMLGTIYYSLRSPEVKVPDIVGKDVSEGEAALDQNGLNMRQRAVRYSANAKPNTILDQSPHPGEVIKVGQTVAVVVSRSDAKEGDSAANAGTAESSNTSNQNSTSNQSSASTNTNENSNDRANRNTKNRNANNSNNSNNTNRLPNKNANANKNTNDRNANDRNDNDRNGNDRDTNNRNLNVTGNGNANRSVNTSNANRRTPLLSSPTPNTNSNRRPPR